ncbi:MAG: MATE family efflux transporter, partial [Turicibacter sp.]
MKNLTSGAEWKCILYFAIPMFVGSLFQQLYNVVDSVIVGQFVGKEALAAVGASFPITLLISSLMLGITVGSSILISQYVGAKDEKNLGHSIQSAYRILFFGTIILTVVGLLSSKQLLMLIKVPEHILNEANSYLQITFLGLLGAFGYNTCSSILRGLGDSKTPMYFLIVSTIINIVLDIVFVVNFKMGVVGVATATLIAQLVSFIGAYTFLHIKSKNYRFKIFTETLDKANMMQSLKLGLPTGVQQMFFSIGILAMQMLVNGFGENVMAAYTAASKLDSFAALPVMNLALATSAFTAQNIGAKKFDRLKNGLYSAGLMAMLSSLIVTVVMWFFGETMMSIFSNDPLVIAYGATYLKIAGSGYIFISLMLIIMDFIRGT